MSVFFLPCIFPLFLFPLPHTHKCMCVCTHIYVFLIQDIALWPMKTVLAPKEMTSVKCNGKWEQRAIRLLELLMAKETWEHLLEELPWWLLTCSTVDFNTLSPLQWSSKNIHLPLLLLAILFFFDGNVLSLWHYCNQIGFTILALVGIEDNGLPSLLLYCVKHYMLVESS